MRAILERTLATAPVASFSFVVVLALAELAVRHGLVADDTLRLWAGAGTAADGEVPIGRIVAAYPTLPFMTTTLLAWLAPPGAPAPVLAAAALLAGVAGFCFLAFRKAGFSTVVALAVTLLIAFHPALLRAAISGPGEMFVAAFLLMLCLALYDLRARSGTTEVMNVGLALMALAFSHPIGAAFAFASVPFLAFAVRPVLVANSAANVVVALVFPTLFTAAAFTYVSWVFPGDGWTFFAAPAQSLSVWTAAVAGHFGAGLSAVPVVAASLTMAGALGIAAPVGPVLLVRVRRRRPLVVPALVFGAATMAATALSVLTGVFGNPAALLIAAPVVAAVVVMRVPVAPERPLVVLLLLGLGWIGGLVSLAVIDPVAVNSLAGASARAGEARLDALAAGGAMAGRDGVLADINNAPAFLLGCGSARGIRGPQSEAFALAMLFDRIEAPYVAVPDPQSVTGAGDRLDAAFPSLFRDGLAGYRLVYQNTTWRIFGNEKYNADHKD